MSERWNTGEAMQKAIRPSLRTLVEEIPRNPKAWKIFEEYGGIPPEDIESHVRAIRQKAWEIFPYPCIGQWRFLDFYLDSRPVYPAIIQRLQSGDNFLDVGTCFGYLLRQLAFDGAPDSNLFGLDLEPRFLDLGYELFRDRDTFGATFKHGNLLDPDDSNLASINGSMDIIHAASLFHLFTWEDQIEVGKRVIRFFKPDAKDPLLVGRQVGMFDPPAHPEDPKACIGRTSHNPKTFQHLWEVIGEQTGTRWKVDASIGDESDGLDTQRVILQFFVTRLK